MEEEETDIRNIGTIFRSTLKLCREYVEPDGMRINVPGCG
jgi:hypothetical protein